MYKNLKIKGLIILAVILACLYSIVGLPKSKDELIANFEKNIKLGLDLRGGSHLVLQVQVQDAFKADADQSIDRLKEEMTKQGINYASMERNDRKVLEQFLVLVQERLALGAVHDHGRDARRQLDGRREAAAAGPDDAELSDAVERGRCGRLG